MQHTGVNSIPIVTFVCLFFGLTLAMLTSYQLEQVGSVLMLGGLVGISFTRELGPLLTGIVVAARVGASITAELGTMKVTEQIDALETLATNPVRYLVVPRFVALVIMLPLLTIYADIIGIIGGYIVGTYKLHITHHMYMKMTYDPLLHKDVFTGLLKAFSFAVIICTISCFEGLKTEGGAEGVGRATTLSVVVSFILVISADCLFTALFYFIFKS